MPLLSLFAAAFLAKKKSHNHCSDDVAGVGGILLMVKKNVYNEYLLSLPEILPDAFDSRLLMQAFIEEKDLVRGTELF